MGKLISNISNYPLSQGSVALNNPLLLEENFRLRQKPIAEYFKILRDISESIEFFQEPGSVPAARYWSDLLNKESLFQVSRFLSLTFHDLHNFFISLPQFNHFNSDNELTENEYETLVYQKLQILQFLFLFYREVTRNLENEPQVSMILKQEAAGKLFQLYLGMLSETMDAGNPLIAEANRLPAAEMDETNFPPLTVELTEELKSWYASGVAVTEPLLTIYATDFEKIKAANEYVYNIFNSLGKIHQSFMSWASAKINELISSTAYHQPHISLLIAFIKLKMLYDARFDRLAYSNTEFIYRDIIGFQKQAAGADTAFISIELARNIQNYFLPANTLFKAGKNEQNKNVFYASIQDVVLSNAVISSIKSTTRLYKDGKLSGVTATDDAADAAWKVNGAWMPFNDIAPAYTGLGIESRLISFVQKKGSRFEIDILFHKKVPAVSNPEKYFLISLLTADEKEEVVNILSVQTRDELLQFKLELAEDLKSSLKQGLNIKISILSPTKESKDNALTLLYQFLLKQKIRKITAARPNTVFLPQQVHSASGISDGKTPFLAFGSQSLAGSSFRMDHPHLRFANSIDLTIQWAEELKDLMELDINGTRKEITERSTISKILDLQHNRKEQVKVSNKTDLTQQFNTTITWGDTTSTITTNIPRTLQVASIEIAADLEEIIYEEGSRDSEKQEYFSSRETEKETGESLSNKEGQKENLKEKNRKQHQKKQRQVFRNEIAYLHPFGNMRFEKQDNLGFLPDPTWMRNNEFEADLFIGIENIVPGQSINLLFEIANETAGQSEKEAKIKWFYSTGSSLEEIPGNKVIDSTLNFLQTGIVQLSLPGEASNAPDFLNDKNSYWLIARCDKNPGVVANIRNIKMNGLAVKRVFDENNSESRISVPANTIESVFPRTANIKAVEQNMPSQNGRSEQTSQDYFWRSSLRLRHKKRAIDQWDFEHLVLEQFPGIYKVKCLNHAFYDDETGKIIARPGHIHLSVFPKLILNTAAINFQPALAVSKLVEIKNFLQAKTSSFLQLQVKNAQWDVVKIELHAVLNEDAIDLPYYKERLSEDLRRFLSPWAYENLQPQHLPQRLFTAHIIDHIDELPYVHHIKSLKIFRNNTEVFDEVISSSEIHILTSAPAHSITVLHFGHGN